MKSATTHYKFYLPTFGSILCIPLEQSFARIICRQAALTSMAGRKIISQSKHVSLVSSVPSAGTASTESTECLWSLSNTEAHEKTNTPIYHAYQSCYFLSLCSKTMHLLGSKTSIITPMFLHTTRFIWLDEDLERTWWEWHMTPAAVSEQSGFSVLLFTALVNTETRALATELPHWSFLPWLVFLGIFHLLYHQRALCRFKNGNVYSTIALAL